MKTNRTSTFAVRITDDIRSLAEVYAKSKGITVTDLIRNSLIEKLEDEYDLKLAEEAFNEFLTNGDVISWEDVKAKYDV